MFTRLPISRNLTPSLYAGSGDPPMPIVPLSYGQPSLKFRRQSVFSTAIGRTLVTLASDWLGSGGSLSQLAEYKVVVLGSVDHKSISTLKYV